MLGLVINEPRLGANAVDALALKLDVLPVLHSMLMFEFARNDCNLIN